MLGTNLPTHNKFNKIFKRNMAKIKLHANHKNNYYFARPLLEKKCTLNQERLTKLRGNINLKQPKLEKKNLI